MHFKDTEMANSVASRGYVQRQILSNNDIRHARGILEKFGVLNDGEGFQNIVNMTDHQEKEQMNRAIVDLLLPKVSNLFNGYIPFIGSFAIKYRARTNNVPLHLDWSVLDETKATSYNVWVALEDMNVENGCMGMLEGSHRFGHTIRGSLINNITMPDSDRPVLQTLKKNYRARTLEMKAGSALIYDHRMAHYSHPNTTDKPRVAISMVMVPEETQLLQYHFEQDGSISVFEMTTDFYLRYDMQTHPSEYLKKVATIPSDRILRSENQLNPLIYV